MRSRRVSMLTGGHRVRAWLHEAALVDEHDCLYAVAEAELLQDVCDVRLDRRRAQVQLIGDLCVRESASDSLEDVELAFAQFAELRWRLDPGWRAADELFDQPTGDCGSEERVA